MISEKVLCTLRVSACSSGLGLELVGHLADLRHQVGLGLHEVADPHPLGALDEDPDRPVRDLEHANDHSGHRDLVQVVGPGLPRTRGP